MGTKKEEPQSKPGTSPEARESQLVNLAVNLAEKQIRDGTASSAVLVHFLKLASTRDRLEREIMEKNAKFLEAKAENISKERESEETAKAAIDAMRRYNPGQ